MRRFLSHTSLVLALFACSAPSLALAAGKHAGASAHARALRIVRLALRERGVPYTYGGTSPRSGFDCSGFTRWVYAHVGISLPHSSYGQFSLGRPVSIVALRPGDLLFFDGLGHVGIYVGGGAVIHAPHTGDVVRYIDASYFSEGLRV